MECLVKNMGIVDAEYFIVTIQREHAAQNTRVADGAAFFRKIAVVQNALVRACFFKQMQFAFAVDGCRNMTAQSAGNLNRQIAERTGAAPN